MRTFSGSTTTLNTTTQFFFEDTFSDAIYAANAVYQHGTRGTTNANDNVYSTISGGGAQLKLRISPNGSRLIVGSFNILVA